MCKFITVEEKLTEAPIIRMLPDTHVVKIGSRSIIDAGRAVTYPVIEALGQVLQSKKLIIRAGGGTRTHHVFSIGIDLGMPTSVLATLAQADALGNAHILGALFFTFLPSPSSPN